MRPAPFVALALAWLPAASALAEDPAAGGGAPVPALAAPEEAKAALEAFKKEFKGTDVDKKAQALFDLAKVQHPLAALEIAKQMGNKNADVKTAAAMALGDLRAMPGLAGQKLVASFALNEGDAVFLMRAVDSATTLGYRGAFPALIKMLKHKNGAVVKAALVTLGDMKDVRAIDTLVDMLKGTKIDAGTSWEGGSVTVDTGTPGDADQKAAEAAYHAKYGGNERKAAAGRKSRDISEVVLLVLKDLTGEQFVKTDQVREWVAKNKAELDRQKAALDETAKKQDAEAAAQLDALKGAR
jgi:HEAT repeat protein